jgi:hypothetical protein
VTTLNIQEPNCGTSIVVQDPNCGLVLNWFKFLYKYGR